MLLVLLVAAVCEPESRVAYAYMSHITPVLYVFDYASCMIFYMSNMHIAGIDSIV